ncbi:glutamine-hydrolyzing carbamoyl-phosphate synthase small subunit [Natronogracilivirga saccharolytica]|uniref:Carbamoyl phosphate synthase small chain n=1 Tax=Natronogracilivirga saccharolytica TaxID=2812953 RepID=A0A8J7UWB2_9BACT|nr:glutamine-hydrolyzing carbamoyl-phosphate synthase small subunit [Natronogracilivirga saccharolytica]MBP3193442.1 glutamine-hydrolyzing carbamoyl-phosphate synthase small subunit [Natronogracilivirga saccharolytica]
MHQTTRKKKAILALADGTVAHGHAIGFHGITGGELCFNTSMTGYQEIFTDPSYHGQLMMMTYPHIGNYGVSSRDDEAHKVMISGLIVRDFSHHYSNTMADGDLDEYLNRNKIVGITGVDTRKLVRHIRRKGVLNAVISSESEDEKALVEQAVQWPSMVGLELASRVSRKEPQTYKPDQFRDYFPRISQNTEDGLLDHPTDPDATGYRQKNPKTLYKVAAIDYGIKQNIINSLVQRGCMLRVFPAKTDFKEIRDWGPDAFFFSNGPGDPNPMDYALETIREAKKTGKPMFGICLGHQLMAMTEGMRVIKMLVGHRGANQPVKNLHRDHVEITTQNHGFAVDPESVTSDVAEITHQNLNDGTLEGLDFKNFDGFGVQYHPEASPGPHDSSYLFDHFVDRIQKHKEKNGSA